MPVSSDYAGFEEFVRDRSVGLLRTAYLLTGNRADAEDLLQEALTGLARQWTKVSRTGSPEAYARRALHNAAIDGYRRHSVRPVVVGEPSATTPAGGDPFADSDRRLTLRDGTWLFLRRRSRS